MRERAGHPVLLCVVPPLAGAVENGMLKAELGLNSSTVLRYTSPFNVLLANLQGVASLPLPPLWFEDSTSIPPHIPSQAVFDAVEQWWLANKAVNKGGAVSAATEAGSATLVTPGTKRHGKRPQRLVQEDSDGG